MCGVWFIAVDAQVRAMDAVQEWSVAVLGERVEEFMVFGASKRGECTVVAAVMAVLVAVVLMMKMSKLHLTPTLQDGLHGSQLRWTLGSSRVIGSSTCAHVTRHTSHVTLTRVSFIITAFIVHRRHHPSFHLTQNLKSTDASQLWAATPPLLPK